MNRIARISSFAFAGLLLAASTSAQMAPVATHPATGDVAPVAREKMQAAKGLEFPKMSINLGNIEEGDVPEISFPVKNTTDKPIAITEVKTSCGCTAKSDDNPTSLAPGEESAISVSFNSKGRRGHQAKTVTIYTDESAGSTYSLNFSTEVISSLFVEPQMLDFGTVEEGTAQTRQFSVISLIEDATITGADSSDPNLKIELVDTKETEKAGRKGTEYIFDVVIPEDYPQANVVARATVKTGKEDQYIQPVIIRGRVVGDITFNPNRSFGVVQSGQSTSRTLTLSSRSGVPFEIIRTELAEKDIPVTIEVLDISKPSEKYVVTEFNGTGEPQTRQSKLLVTVKAENKEKESTLEVPIIYVHRPDPKNLNTMPKKPQAAIVPAMPKQPADMNKSSGSM